MIRTLTQSRAVQVAVKALKVPLVGHWVLRLVNARRRVPRSDLRYRVRYLDTFMLANGIFEGGEYAALGPDARKIQTFVDLGCNVGLFPLYLCRLRGDTAVRGICVDGSPAMATEATANMALNGLSAVHVIHGMAGAGEVGTTHEFFVAQDSTSSTASPELLGTRFGVRKIVVTTVDPLAEFRKHCGGGRIDLLKIDIEGAELTLLDTSPDLLEAADRIILEFHRPHATYEDIRKRLEPRGWSARHVDQREEAPWGVAYFVRDGVTERAV